MELSPERQCRNGISFLKCKKSVLHAINSLPIVLNGLKKSMNDGYHSYDTIKSLHLYFMCIQCKQYPVTDMGSIQFRNWWSIPIPELELTIYKKINWNWEILNWNWEIFNLKFPTKKLNPKINIPFLQC